MATPESQRIAEKLLRRALRDQALRRLTEAMERQAEASALIAQTLQAILERLPPEPANRSQ